MIHVIATIALQPGARERYLAILKANVPNVLAEKGCRGYAPAVDTASGLPVQGPLRPDTVVLVETWDDLPALKAHLAAPHMAAYREQVRDLVRSVNLQVLESA
jgi:quinol monooxygenase YgiN